MCGGDLVLTEGNPLATCEYCGTLQTVPSADSEKKLTLFSRANRLRAACEFDKAFGLYEAIVADFPEEAEAYWGLVLCKFGIEYVDDPATGKKVPTCHRSSFDSVMDDVNFEQTLENADPLARKVYRDEAKQMEELRKDILAVSGKADPYDIFICYKETDIKGERTLDSVLAQDVYDALTDKGYRVFFSRISLEDKLGQEYEPYIFAALNSAKVMLVVGTDYEYFNAVWVKNEWGRFLKMMEKDKSKHLIPCFKGIDAYDMPKEFHRLQAQDLGKVGAIQDLLRGIEKIMPQQEAVPAAIHQEKAETSVEQKHFLQNAPLRKNAMLVSGAAHILSAVAFLLFLMWDRDHSFTNALMYNMDAISLFGALAVRGFHVLMRVTAGILVLVGTLKQKQEKFFIPPTILYVLLTLIPLTSVGPDYMGAFILYAPQFLAGSLSLVFILLRQAKASAFTSLLQFLAKGCLILGCATALLLLTMGGSIAMFYLDLTLVAPIALSVAMWKKK
jgi:hypothetical protein